MSLVYHYTSASQHLPQILESEELRPSNAGGHQGEPPLLWFSREQSWEPTAGKAVMFLGRIKLLNMRQQFSSFGCARFGIDSKDPRLMEWADACQHAGIGRDERRTMERAGKDRGGKHINWLAIPSAVPVHELVCEVFNGSAWEDRT